MKVGFFKIKDFYSHAQEYQKSIDSQVTSETKKSSAARKIAMLKEEGFWSTLWTIIITFYAKLYKLTAKNEILAIMHFYSCSKLKQMWIKSWFQKVCFHIWSPFLRSMNFFVKSFSPESLHSLLEKFFLEWIEKGLLFREIAGVTAIIFSSSSFSFKIASISSNF